MTLRFTLSFNRIFIFILLLVINSQIAFSQKDKEKAVEKSYYKFSNPFFFREEKGIQEYFTERVKIKQKDFKSIVTGNLIAVFTLAKDQTIKNLRMTDSTSSSEINTEVMEWIKLSKEKWQVAKINDGPVDVDMFISFRLNAIDGQRIGYIISCSYQMIIDPVLATAFYNAGSEEAGKENFADATKYFNETILISPNDIDALFNRGICRYKSGDQSGGCEDWKKIQTLGKADADKLILKYCNN
jgi:hypothetical protein